MKIEINLKIILAIILFFLFDDISTYLIFIIFIIIHEFAHLIVGIALGGKPKSININPFGLSLDFYSYGKDNFFCRILFYFSGPLINLLIFLISANFYKSNSYKIEIIYTNLALFLFNLLPILPLDGGKILKEVLKEIIGIEKSNRFMIIFSKTILVIISFIYSIVIIKIKNIMLLFLLTYLWYLYFIEEKKYYIYKKVKESIRELI